MPLQANLRLGERLRMLLCHTIGSTSLWRRKNIDNHTDPNDSHY